MLIVSSLGRLCSLAIDDLVLEKKELGKLKIGLVICVVLIGILAFYTFLFFVQAESFGTANSIIADQKRDLLNQLDNLQSDLDDLQIQRDSLESIYQNYVDDRQCSDSEFWDYVAGHLYTNEEYNETRFEFYYVKPEQKFGVYDLEDDIDGLVWNTDYEEGVFDCSEMSASLERYLENEGWNTVIIAGDSPFGSGYHAWLLVETSEGKYMPVESTTIDVVWWEDANFDNYFEYDHEFETIQEALAHNESEFDWWAS